MVCELRAGDSTHLSCALFWCYELSFARSLKFFIVLKRRSLFQLEWPLQCSFNRSSAAHPLHIVYMLLHWGGIAVSISTHRAHTVQTSRDPSFKGTFVTKLIFVFPSLVKRCKPQKEWCIFGPTSRVISVSNVCVYARVCCLYVCKPLLYKSVIYSRTTICKIPSAKHQRMKWSLYRRVRAKALFYAYKIAKGKLYSNEHFKVETSPPPTP